MKLLVFLGMLFSVEPVSLEEVLVGIRLIVPMTVQVFKRVGT